MNFQEQDILICICHQCDKTSVSAAKKHLDGPDFPSWTFIVEFVNELELYNEYVEYWEEPGQIYDLADIRALFTKYINYRLSDLEKIYAGLEL